jgi:sugar/nucleoside kinase (ribokinase family)
MMSSRPYHFAVFANAVVDAIAHVDDALLAGFGLHKGDSNTLSHAQMMELTDAITVEQFRAGGAGANLAYTLARLGSRVAFVGQVGADPTGRFFAEDMVAAGVALTPPQNGYRTTDVFTLITVDGARTMVQCMPPSPSPEDAWVDDSFIEKSAYLYIEAYAAGAFPAAADYAAKVAARSGCKLVVGLNSPRAVQAALSTLTDLITSYQPLVIGNIAEWDLLITNADAHTAKRLEQTPRVVTRSGKGAAYYEANGGAVVDSPTQPIPRPTDLTGAGTAFTAGFLHVFTGGGSPQLALKQGHQLARAVILQLGPRLQTIPQVDPENQPQTD